MGMTELNDRFKHHPPVTKQDIADHDAVREVCLRAAQELRVIVPEGREAALVQTKLEEAMFWANAGLARTRA